MKLLFVAMALANNLIFLDISEVAAEYYSVASPDKIKSCILSGKTWSECGLPDIYTPNKDTSVPELFKAEEGYSFGDFRVPWLMYAPNYLLEY